MVNIKNIILSLLLLTYLISCGYNITKTSNTTGEWVHTKSRVMGGYSISQNNKLIIIRNGPGDYEYTLTTVTTDQMYGGVPKRSFSSGKLDSKTIGNEWRFVSGEFGERGGYIQVPTDRWDDYIPTDILIKFAPNRGDEMNFTRD